ncbi:Uncharacterised protein [Mycobacteroides abscessus subsp. abscessus]|nr:Uncharacterised protein [Mycobacteroides abscessus subsp. abscessus]
MSRQSVAFGIGKILGHGPAEGAVLAHQDVGQSLVSALFGELLPAVQGAARLVGAAGHHDGAHVRRLEHAEAGLREVVGALHQLQAESQVRLVAAVPPHRLGIGDAVDGCRHPVADQIPQRDEDLLGERDDIVLVHEAHLDVELGEFGLPVGAEILVPVTARDLVIPLHTGDHEQLLEQLRALRQRVETARL